MLDPETLTPIGVEFPVGFEFVGNEIISQRIRQIWFHRIHFDPLNQTDLP